MAEREATVRRSMKYDMANMAKTAEEYHVAVLQKSETVDLPKKPRMPAGPRTKLNLRKTMMLKKFKEVGKNTP